MLRDILYEMLMKATRFVTGIAILEGFFDMERNIFGRFIVKVSNIINWVLTQLLLISLTGGLYLVWVLVKMIFKKYKKNHKNGN